MRPEDTFDPKIFYTKSTDWSYEQEERLVVQLALHTECEQKDSYPIYKFKIPYDCISDITLGLRASSELEGKVKSMAKEIGFSVYKTKRSQRLFNLEREEIF